jgi:hypothetical protein
MNKYTREFHEQIEETLGIVTGVMSGHDLDWDVLDYNEMVCIDCEVAYEDWLEENPDAETDEFWGQHECSGHDHLYGDWKQGKGGKWEADRDGRQGFALIYDSNMNVAQVVWSRIAKWTWWCSPCYPGQGDVDEESMLITEPRPWRTRLDLPRSSQLIEAVKRLVRVIQDERDGTISFDLMRIAEDMAHIALLKMDKDEILFAVRRAVDKGSEKTWGELLKEYGYRDFAEPSCREWIERIEKAHKYEAMYIGEWYLGMERPVAAYALPVNADEWAILNEVK